LAAEDYLPENGRCQETSFEEKKTLQRIADRAQQEGKGEREGLPFSRVGERWIKLGVPHLEYDRTRDKGLGANSRAVPNKLAGTFLLMCKVKGENWPNQGCSEGLILRTVVKRRQRISPYGGIRTDRGGTDNGARID